LRGITVSAFLILLLVWCVHADAQSYWCPAGTTPISNGMGTSCQCPDGSLASIAGCPTSFQQPSYSPSSRDLSAARAAAKAQADQLARQRAAIAEAERQRAAIIQYAEDVRLDLMKSRETALQQARQQDVLTNNLGVPPSQTTPGLPSTIVAPPLSALLQTPSPSSQPSAANTQGAVSPGYTFAPTVYGTVAISKNGSLIATGTPQFAAQYGYEAPNANAAPAPAGNPPSAAPATAPVVVGIPTTSVQPAPNSTVASPTAAPTLTLNANTKSDITTLLPPSSGASAATQSLGSATIANQAVPASPFVTANAVSTSATVAAGGLANTTQTIVSKIAVDTVTAGIGGAASAISPGGIVYGIGQVNTAASFYSALQSGGGFGLANAAAKEGLTIVATGAGQAIGASAAVAGAEAAGSAAMATAIGGAALGGGLAAGVAVGSYEFGQYVIAPMVAPTLGSLMFDAAPSVFEH
jgi:hypothetical protein